VLPFDFLQRPLPEDAPGRPFPFAAPSRRSDRRMTPRSQQHGALENVAQLADVAGPGVLD
jgi:hypothetical protein